MNAKHEYQLQLANDNKEAIPIINHQIILNHVVIENAEVLYYFIDFEEFAHFENMMTICSGYCKKRCYEIIYNHHFSERVEGWKSNSVKYLLFLELEDTNAGGASVVTAITYLQNFLN